MLALPFALSCAYFFWRLASELGDGTATMIVLRAIALLMALAALALVAILIKPVMMTVGPDGVALGWMSKPRKFAWSHFHTFHVAGVVPFLTAGFVAYTTPARPRFKISLGGGLELKPREMVALLTEARRRWGPPA